MNLLKDHLACLKQLESNSEFYNLNDAEKQNVSEIIKRLETHSKLDDAKTYGEFAKIIADLANVLWDIFGNSS